jgi:ABC-2 type transport system ATP-binding protein
MPELLGPSGSGRGDHSLIADWTTKKPLPAPSNLQPAIGNLPSGKEPLLLCQRVSKWYGPVLGLNQVTLELRSGITGLVGPNGSGKSTLMRLITGQLRPDLGSVAVRGLGAWGAAAKRHVGYCPEVDAFYEEMSGRQFVQSMARLCGYPRREARRRTDFVLELVGMSGRAERRLRGYSKGMRQRVKLAQALLHDPDLLVLDEPLSGIDPVGRRELVALFRGLAERGKCLLVSSHELDELEKLTDHVVILSRGRIAAVGTVAQIRERLDDHPRTIRVDIARGESPRKAGSNGEVQTKADGRPAPAGDRQRELAAALVALPGVVGVELLPDEGPGDPVSRVLVQARSPQRFFQGLTRLVLEEWYEVRHLQALDESTQAVLSYLLGGSGG